MTALPDRTATPAGHLLTLLQTGVPIVARPFGVIGEKVGLSEREVIDAVIAAKDDGRIRAFGPVFDPRRIGYVSTLAAASVEEDRIAELAAALLDITEITHNYLRDHERNLWFTITARTPEILDRILRWATRFSGVREVLSLPVVRVFKINTVWGSAESGQVGASADAVPVTLTEMDRQLIRALQSEFPVLERPFSLIAASLDISEDDVLGRVREWLENGAIRRFGARLAHRVAGYTENVLIAWKSPDSTALGEQFAQFPAVSHCYLRESHPSWPYDLYTMVHARSASEMRQIIGQMEALSPGSRQVKLRSRYELKKTTMKYFLEHEPWDTLPNV